MGETGAKRGDGRLGSAILLVSVLFSLALAVRSFRDGAGPAPEGPLPAVIEVKGDVPRPGVYVVSGERVPLCDALALAGWSELVPGDLCPVALESGESVTLSVSEASCRVMVSRMQSASRLVLGQKLDMNSATENDLLQIPQMRRELAAAIVQEREKRPWRDVNELAGLHGVGPKTVEQMKKYLEVTSEERELTVPCGEVRK